MPRRLPPLLAFSCLLAVTIAPLGCDVGRHFNTVEQWAGSSVNRLSFRRAKDRAAQFEVARPVAIDVDSFGGDVIIEADERLEHATVQVTRVATHGFGRAHEADASLAAIRYTIEVARGEIGQVLVVQAWTDHPEPHFQQANIRIRVPEVEGVRVHTERGRVHATNIEGAVDIATTRGAVRVMTNRPMTEPVMIVNVEGGIDYRVRGESTGIIDAESSGGVVLHRVNYGRLRIDGTLDTNQLHATLNDGTNRVVLRTVDADIRIAVVDDPLHIGRWIVTP